MKDVQIFHYLHNHVPFARWNAVAGGWCKREWLFYLFLFSALLLKVCDKKQEKFHPTLETIDGKEP